MKIFSRAWEGGRMHYDLNYIMSGREGGFCACHECPLIRPVLMLRSDAQDASGKSIYVSDIVSVDFGLDTPAIARVVFACSAFMLEWIDDPEAMMEMMEVDKQGRPRKLAVLGNEYQNPELLRKN